MAKRVADISVRLSAGTGQFVLDMEKAKVKVKDFQNSLRGASSEMHGSVSQVQAVSGALRVMEGGMNGSLRAAERFLATTAGLGPMLQKAFPVVGAIAFTEILVKMGEEAYKFVEAIRTAPEKMAGAFRSIAGPLQQTNDELKVANDRLENDIAKLEGKRQNTLKLALDEARLAADKLAESLDRDLASLHKVLDENNISQARRLFTGDASTTDVKEQIGGQTGFGGFRGEIAKIQETSAPDKLADNLRAAYTTEIGKVRQMIMDSNELQKRFDDDYLAETKGGAADQTARLEILRRTLQQLQGEQQSIALRGTNSSLTQQKDALTAAASNAKLDRPFEDRMKALGGELDGVKAKMAAVGQGEAAETLTKGFTNAWRIIEEVNKALEKQHSALTFNQIAAIQSVSQQIAQGAAEGAWKQKLDQTTKSIDDRIKSQEMLTAAIGKGYEATKAANVETKLMLAVGAEHYTDSNWMSDPKNGVAALRSKISSGDETQHVGQITAAVNALKQQINLEKSLAAAQINGAEAVRQASLAWKIRQMEMTGATKEQIQAERDLYAAQRQNVSDEAVAKLNLERTATERLTAAVWQGAEAIRKAGLENKYAQMATDKNVTPEVIQQTRTQDAAQHQENMSAEAAKLATSYGDSLQHVNDMIAQLQKARATQGDTLSIEIALRDLENERLRIMADQTVQQGRAQDGVRAFFLEMQQTAKLPGAIVYEALNSALDKTSDNLTKLLTGQKTAWGKMFQGIGEQMLKETIKSGLQKLIGAATGKRDGSNPAQAIYVQDVGAVSGPNGKPITFGNGGLLGTGQVPKIGGAGGVLGLPDGTSSNPYYVVPIDGAGSPGAANQGWDQIVKPQPRGQSIWSTLGAAAIRAIGGSLGRGGGGGGGGDTPDVSSTVSYPGFADGVDSTPAGAYMVGERGPELMVGAGNRIFSNAESRRMLAGGDGGATYLIDARGTDPQQTEQRVKKALVQVHGSAVVNSVRTVHDMERRMPKRN